MGRSSCWRRILKSEILEIFEAKFTINSFAGHGVDDDRRPGHGGGGGGHGGGGAHFASAGAHYAGGANRGGSRYVGGGGGGYGPGWGAVGVGVGVGLRLGGPYGYAGDPCDYGSPYYGTPYCDTSYNGW